MYYLIPIPFVFLGAIVYVVSTQYKLNSFKLISKLTIILSVIAFIYLYSAYNGYDLLEFLKDFI